MEILRFVLLGIGTGGVYAMLAQGLVLVYRGSGLLNFAQGAIAMVGAYTYYECTSRHHLPLVVGLVVGVLACAVLGALIHLLILRRMQRSSSLSRVIVTLGITIALQAGAYLRYGHDPLPVKSVLSTRTVHVFSDQLPVGMNIIVIFGLSAVLTVILALVYKRTSFGRVTTAVAEKQRVAATLGHSPDLIATANWALGGAIAGLGGILIAPLLFLEPTQLVLLVLPAMSAALLGGFVSFPVTFATAAALGIAQSLIGRYVNEPGWSSAAPFIAVVVVLVLRGQVLPLRSYVLDRLPAVGNGRIPPVRVALLYGVGAYLTLNAGPDWAAAMTTTLALALICMSLVVITGYAGQLSLAHTVIAAIGALVAARLSAHVPYLAAIGIGALAAAVTGVLIGIPALRTRGATLAIATLGLGTALVSVVLTNVKYTNGQNGLIPAHLEIFGWNIDPVFHANRYAFVALTAVLLVGVIIANLRRGAIGRQLLAVRSNERAAASLGLPGSALKAYAFVLSSALAGIGGVVFAFAQPTVLFNGTTDNFSVFASVTIIAMTVAGGVGSVGGALLGSLMLSGGVLAKLLNGWGSINDYLPLIGGVGLILVLLQGPDGVFEYNRVQIAKVTAKLGTRVPRLRLFSGRRTDPLAASPPRVPITPAALRVQGLSVHFGGIKALSDVDLVVEPGTVHGLIGPNGAGKTTFIDAVTGFVRTEGQVLLGDVVLTGRNTRDRARAGVSRSFQSLELFNDLTVLENLAVASDQTRRRRYLTDLFWPGRPRLSAAALEAVRQFELSGLIDAKPDSISFGQRKTVAIARAIAASPVVLMLDEPAAGLNDYEAAELARLIRVVADEWNIGVLLVEHKVDMVMSISDRVTVLESGRVLASGSPQEVMASDAVIEAYLGTSTEAPSRV
jgi:ABC-type branched-subunit amino acid transport system ATPase component/branched-subunit amino acid ABC-type transport system permease component